MNLVVIVILEVIILVHGIDSGNSEDDLKKTKGSLVFVFDGTGSMSDDLQEVIKGATSIINTMKNREYSPIQNYVLVPFRDPKVGPVTITTNDEEFKKALNDIQIAGGSDCPEYSLSGIETALNASLPNSYIYVFSDASAKDHFLLENVLPLVQRKHSQIVFVLTGDCNDRNQSTYQVYEKIAAASTGQVFRLKKDEVFKVLKYVEDTLDADQVNLGLVIHPKGEDYTHDISVDNTLKKVTVSVSGGNAKLEIKNPQGAIIDGPPKLSKLLDLSEIQIINIINPEPGNWSVSISSDMDHSVKVTGISKIKFEHGFFINETETLSETSNRPLHGTPNHLLIAIKDSLDDITNVESIDITDTSGKHLFEIPLMKLNNSKHMYKTLAFIPPEDFFNIAINGIDADGNTFKRIGSTAIHSQYPEKPFITMNKEILAPLHQQVNLTCKIESLVPISVVWYKNKTLIQNKQHFLQSAVSEYPIVDADNDTAGTYTCLATNIAGASNEKVDVVVIGKLPVVSILPQNTIVLENSEISIRCIVESDSMVQSIECKFKSDITDGYSTLEMLKERESDAISTYTHLISHVRLNDTGFYHCKVNNEMGTAENFTHIEVVPNIYINTSQSIVKYKIGQNFNISCTIYGSKKGKWIIPLSSTAQNTDIVSNVNESLELMFIIDNATLDNEGIYFCQASNIAGIVQKSITLSILPPLEVIVWPETIQYEEDDNITIACHIKGSIIGSWSITNDRMNNVELSHPKYIGDDEVIIEITIYNANMLNEGLFVCSGLQQDEIINSTSELIYEKAPKVITTESEFSIEINTEAVLRCDTIGKPKPDIYWILPNSKDIFSKTSSGRIYINYKNDLIIQNISSLDDGDYKCKAKNNRGLAEKTLSISTWMKPYLKEIHLNKTVAIYENLKLMCDFEGKPKPKVRWFHDNREIFVDELQLINLSNISISNGGKYSCVGENEHGSLTNDFYIEITGLELPLLQEISFHQIAIEGDVVKIPCRLLKGKPLPLISWERSGLSINQTTIKSDYHFGSNINTLVIPNAALIDEGYYTCKALNDLGYDFTEIYLEVQQPPSFHSDHQSDDSNLGDNLDSSIEAIAGSDVTFSCDISGKPKPIVFWTKDKVSILFNDNNHRNDVEKNEFHILNVTTIDSGKYSCTGKNVLGNNTKHFYLSVLMPPIIRLDENQFYKFKLGSTVSIECTAEGFPLPNIKWSGYDNTIDNQFKESIIINNGNMTIVNISHDHAGSYICEAENKVGAAKKIYNIVVYEIPKILDSGIPKNIQLSTSENKFKIPCQASGYPLPKIAWFYNKKPIENEFEVKDDGTLILKHLNENQNGAYTCEAKNTEGSDHVEYNISIIAPPSMKNIYEKTLVFLESSNATITCPLGATNAITEIKWYKNNDLIQNYTKRTLELFNISRKDATNYTCVVSNAMGNASASFQVFVNWSPVLIGENETNVDVQQNDFLELNCLVDANPDCKYQWIKNNIAMNEITSSLVREKADIHHAGEYMCIAFNSVGKVTKKYFVVVSVPPSIEGDSSNIVEVELNDQLNLECITHGIPSPSIEWDVKYESDWTEIDNRSLITSYNISMNSEGSHVCRAKNYRGVAEKTFIVNVYQQPKIVDVSISNKNIIENITNGVYYVKNGDQMQFSCLSIGKPSPDVIWIQNGKILNDSTLYFQNTSVSDSGRYICMATNKVGSDEYEIVINVLASPKIHDHVLYRLYRGNQLLTPIEYQFISLNCYASGNPTPEIYWFKDGKHIGFYDSNIIAENIGQVLLIRRIQRYHSGNFSCIAKNVIGEDEKIFNVDVMYAPEKMNDHHIRARMGDDVEFSCPNSGNPKSSIKWLKNPYFEIDNDKNSRLSLKNENNTMIISNVSLSDDGKYSCILTNTVGMAENIFSLEVVYAPKINSDIYLHRNREDLIKIKIKRSVQLHCNIISHPQPIIWWIKDGKAIDNRYTDSIFISSDGQLLNLMNAKLNDSGEYICIAENEVGRSENIFHVKVVVPAAWSIWSEWSACNSSCGMGYKNRTRNCEYYGDQQLDDFVQYDSTKLDDVLDTSDCVGMSSDYTECFDIPCRIDGGWSEWGDWSNCSLKCGLGEQKRHRTCTNPTPKYGGSQCVGSSIDKKACEGSDCSLWYSWSPWSSCSVTCGKGTRTRFRRCNGPEDTCFGNSSEIAECVYNDCNDSIWSPWSDWSECSTSCGRGHMRRTRYCEGRSCKGGDIQMKQCDNTISCDQNDIGLKTLNQPMHVVRKPNQSYFKPMPSYNREQTDHSYISFSPQQKNASIIGVNNFDGLSSEEIKRQEYSMENSMKTSRAQHCSHGYLYNTELMACSDINECEGEDQPMCHSTQMCINTPGSFRCVCESGYLSMGIGERCLDINECSRNPDYCSHGCYNVPGSFICTCPSTHTLSNDKKTCIDKQILYDEDNDGALIDIQI